MTEQKEMNEFLLEDRLQKIRQIIGKYGEENFYLSFSGGKDSTVLSHLIDEALPGNKIPRVYANTGIEYKKIVEFVEREREREHSWELVILKPKKNIKAMLEEEGYPFKSKKHAETVGHFQRRGYEMTKWTIRYLQGHLSDNARNYSGEFACPECLKYQFSKDFKLKLSDKCCLRLKEDPLKVWQKENKKPYAILGLMRAEGGRRRDANCLAFKKGVFKAFQPLAPLTKEWEDWYITKRNIELAVLYYPPYNFNRTGCKGCPFNPNLQRELDTLDKYFPEERKQCEIIWKPVYEEYRRIGYRKMRPLDEGRQITLEEFMDDEDRKKL